MMSRSGGRSSIALIQGFVAAIRAASRKAAIRLDGLALPVPAMSKAVPWSGEVRMNGNPERDVDGVLEGDRLDRDQRLVVIHADRAVIGLARGGVEQGVRRQRAANRDALGAQGFDGRRDDVEIFGAERAVLAGMRVEAGDDEARMGEAETGFQIPDHDAGGRDDQFARSAARAPRAAPDGSSPAPRQAPATTASSPAAGCGRHRRRARREIRCGRDGGSLRGKARSWRSDW